MTDTRWLTQPEEQTWRLFAAVLIMVPEEVEGQLQREAELTHFGYWVLSTLSEAPGRAIRMNELARMAHGSRSRLSHSVAGLERNGWVRRERVADDGRGYVAVLTEAGHAKVVAAAPGHVAAVRAAVLDALDPERLAQLRDICTRLITNIDAKRAAAR